MTHLYKLVLKTNIKSPNIIFPFAMPLLFILILSPGFSTSEQVTVGIVSIVSVSTMQSGLMGFGYNFMNLKKSVLLRRIGATKISKFEALMAVIFYGLTIWFISIFWIFSLTAIFSAIGFFENNAKFLWNGVDWPLFLIAIILSLVVSYPLGLLFLSITKDDDQYSAIVMFYFFMASFIGGMLLPGADIEWMRYTGYAIPNVYNAHMFEAIGHGKTISEVFNFSSGYSYEIEVSSHLKEVTVEAWEAILNLVIPIVTGIASLLLSLKFFKWEG